MLLVLAFGTVVAALLPVVSGTLAVALSLGLISLLATRTSLSILVVNVASMLGLALGIDYALLTVSRFREARAAGLRLRRGRAAAPRAHAGATVMLSGLPVAIGFLALLLVPLNELRSAAVGGLVVTVVSVLLATTVLPALLTWLGPWVEAGRLLRLDLAGRGGLYRRFATGVVARPVLVLVLTVPPLAPSRRPGTAPLGFHPAREPGSPRRWSRPGPSATFAPWGEAALSTPCGCSWSCPRTRRP